MLIHIVRQRFIMKWTEEILEELKSIEDAIDAYENGYYDTHDLDYIGDNLSDYKDTIENYIEYLPNKKYGFLAYDLKGDKLVLNVA